ncbi:YoaK family protein [Oerskovia jenensis]|uniref:YoaK family protein n=1 Tax=Oerskovia jenensis TaxID=162169 RepID=UPI0036DE6568
MDPEPVHRHYRVLLLVLTFSTGIIDGICYLALDQVFTANMTGNVLILGMGLAGGQDVPTAGPLMALAAYVTGAAIAGYAFRNRPAGWHRTTTGLFAGVGLGVLVASLVAHLVGRPGGWRLLVLVAVLGVSMGVQAATARHLSVKDLTTVVVTSTLTGLAADSFRDGRDRRAWVRRVSAVVALGSGAAVGALLLRAGIEIALLVPGAIALGTAVVGEAYRRTDRRRASARPPGTEAR